jgi:hypothetical protein
MRAATRAKSLPSPQLLSDAVDICDAVIAEDRLR